MTSSHFEPPRLISQWNQISDVAAKRSGASGRRPLRIHARVGLNNGGGKPALVLVPGLVVTSRNVAPTARLLQDRFSVYALDLPGFGCEINLRDGWLPLRYGGAHSHCRKGDGTKKLDCFDIVVVRRHRRHLTVYCD